MIVKISEFPVNLIKPESELETAMLRSEILRSKIAFKIKNHIDEDGFLIKLKRENKKPLVYSESNAEIAVGFEDTNKLSCFLRMALDANSVNYRCLPLHAAYIQSKNRGVVLVADSTGGKSLIFNWYVGSSYALVGDDHVIIRDGLISGNQISRVRRPGNTPVYREINSETQVMKPYNIVMVDATIRNTYSELSKKEVVSNATLSNLLLTYLNGGIYYDNVYYPPTEIFGSNVVGKYLSDYSKFVEKSETVIQIGGSYPFIKKSIDKMIWNGQTSENH